MLSIVLNLSGGNYEDTFLDLRVGTLAMALIIAALYKPPLVQSFKPLL